MTGQADYGWYGDDFTGATDTLATLAERGYRAMLFLDIPDAAQLQAAGPLDAIGIAGATRSMPPDRIAGELDRAGRLFADRRVRLIHYKCCSTFDSSPRIGSIGAAVAALRPYASNPLLPIIGGQPNLGRYCPLRPALRCSRVGRHGPPHRPPPDDEPASGHPDGGGRSAPSSRRAGSVSHRACRLPRRRLCPRTDRHRPLRRRAGGRSRHDRARHGETPGRWPDARHRREFGRPRLCLPPCPRARSRP